MAAAGPSPRPVAPWHAAQPSLIHRLAPREAGAATDGRAGTTTRALAPDPASSAGPKARMTAMSWSSWVGERAKPGMEVPGAPWVMVVERSIDVAGVPRGVVRQAKVPVVKSRMGPAM